MRDDREAPKRQTKRGVSERRQRIDDGFDAAAAEDKKNREKAAAARRWAVLPTFQQLSRCFHRRMLRGGCAIVL